MHKLKKVGLKMNMDKTKIMSNTHVAPIPVSIGSAAIEVVDHYIYLGQVVQLGRSALSNFDKEVNRRIQLGWAAFGKLRHVFSSQMWCVLPVMTYGTETWPLTFGLIQKLKVAQRAMERAMLGIVLRDLEVALRLTEPAAVGAAGAGGAGGSGAPDDASPRRREPVVTQPLATA